ncbi:MAG: hypothetical protein ACOY90_11060 [Candidatus Zhuqueibacterota bacterium]
MKFQWRRTWIMVLTLALILVSGCKKTETIYLNNYGLGMMTKEIDGIKKITIKEIQKPSGFSHAKIFVNTIEVYNPSEWIELKPDVELLTRTGENNFWFKVMDADSQLVRDLNFKIAFTVQQKPPIELVHDEKFE